MTIQTTAPIFHKGDRVRDPLTRKLGTYQGLVTLRGSMIASAVHWDDTPQAVPCTFRLELFTREARIRRLIERILELQETATGAEAVRLDDRIEWIENTTGINY